jgi:uncharacterized membrane protein YhaH (DUF805 family)
MSFTEAVQTVYRNYAKFDGRASRPEYWWFVLFYLLVAIAAWTIAIALGGAGTFTDSDTYPYYRYSPSPLFSIMLLGLAIFAIATFLPGLAVAVRRLHDTDKSGWWLLLSFVPYIGGIAVLILLALPSSAGINQYGPPPGMAGDVRRVNYRAPSPQETWSQYTDDAQRAAANGYQPVAQQWKRDGMGDYLEVTYTSATMGWQQPGWQAPTWQQAPAAGGQTPPPGPMSASTQGGQHPFDGPPPDRPNDA